MKLSGRVEGGDVLVLALREAALDVANVRQFREAAHALIQGRTQVVLDLTDVGFVDSAGLGALISCLRHIRASQGDMKLCSMSKPVRALFELTRMHRVFGIVETRDEAVRSFA
jgi:anti-sigma B factor antagonist